MKLNLLIAFVLLILTNVVNAQRDTVYVKEAAYSPAGEVAAAPQNVATDNNKGDKYDIGDKDRDVSFSHDARDRFKFGLKAGAIYSNIYDVTSNNFAADFRWGFTGGLFMGIPIGKWIGLQPEILYSQRGYKSTGDILGSAYSNTHTSKYIDVPLLLQLKPSDFVTVVGGVQYSFLVSHDNTAQQQQSFDKLNIRKNTFGVTGGLDININHVVLGGRVGWDLQDNNGDGTSTSPRYKNYWYQATLGFRF